MSKIDNRAYIRQIVDEYFEEADFEAFLRDTVEAIIDLEQRIEELEEELNGKTT